MREPASIRLEEGKPRKCDQSQIILGLWGQKTPVPMNLAVTRLSAVVWMNDRQPESAVPVHIDARRRNEFRRIEAQLLWSMKSSARAHYLSAVVPDLAANRQ